MNDINIINEKFMEECKKLNLSQIKKYFIPYNNDINYIKVYNYIYNIFVKFDLNTDKNIIKKIITILKYFIEQSINHKINISLEKLTNTINHKSKIFIDNKKIYSLFKLLIIFINKKIINLNNNLNNTIFIKIQTIINVMRNTINNKRIIFYINKITNYINKNNNNLDFEGILKNIELLFNDIKNKENTMNLLNLMNKCKKFILNKNDLESILSKSDKNVYDYIYFMNNSDNLFIEKKNIFDFVSLLNYEKKAFQSIDKLNLKRGFITGLFKNNRDYLLKYQPNKSVMELVINSYLKSFHYPNFLIPIHFFINKDNSYFYIIEKYNTDLFKFFNILESKSKILELKDIKYIIFFIINSIEILHKNNIIHSDIKLENIVLNFDKNLNISELKIIDFDVALFNKIPPNYDYIPDNYFKPFNDKKIRGTKSYMLKSESMSFKNDIYSLGVITLMIFYKNVKLDLILKRKVLNSGKIQNKKSLIDIQTKLTKLNNYRENLEKDDVKIKMLTFICNYLKKKLKDKNDLNDIIFFKTFILDCLNTKFDINALKEKYEKILFINI